MLESVEVSTFASNLGLSSALLSDGDTSTCWQSDGPGPPHAITVKLKQPSAVARFGMIIDEDDDSYCPKKVQVLVGFSEDHMIVVATRRIGEIGSKGPKYVLLLEDLGNAVSVLRVKIIDSGGCDCRVRGLFIRLDAQVV